jgi:thiol-disulfide isomerase/thioredoxin
MPTSIDRMVHSALAFLTVAGWSGSTSLAAPAPKEALSFTPIQTHVEYDTPPAAQLEQCVVRAEKYLDGTAWFVRGPDGQLLRRFADTNGDNVVDQWSYFQNGLEVYRDIDSNYNNRADQYRWFHTAGTRWGIDKDEDGVIDSWKEISPPELAEQVVLALRSKNTRQFAPLLLTEGELSRLGLGDEHLRDLRSRVQSAQKAFAELSKNQKTISEDAKFVDFGASRPATVPAGTNGSTGDVTVYENVSALVETGSDHVQVYLGTLMAVDNGWRLVDVPSLDDAGSAAFSLIAASSVGAAPATPAGAPTEKMQPLMEKLQKLDLDAAKLPLDKQGPITAERVKVLEELAAVTDDPALRSQWYQQMADMLSAAVQGGGYPEGLPLLERLEQRLADAGAGASLLGHVSFRHMLAEYMHNQQQPNADFVKIQGQWLRDLEDYAKKYPENPDAAEAQLQLGMSQEFSGQLDAAADWYRRIVKDFPDTDHSRKAAGALTRLNSEGKPIRLRGEALLGGGQVDLAGYRGKVVLVQYWATWCEPCKADMAHLKELYAKYRSRGFEIVGVCLDDDAGPAQAYAAQAKLPWKHLYEPGGLNGRLANEMGVLTLPLMMLVDQRGNVALRSIQAVETESELQELLGDRS